MKLGAITAGVNDRLSERGARRRSSRSRARGSSSPPTSAPGGIGRDRARALRVAGEAPPALADDPDRPVAIIFTSGTTGLPKGALYCNRQLAFITQTDVGDTWDGGGRSFSGTSFAHLGFMTKLPGQPAPRRHDVHHGALARRPTRSSCSRREQHDDGRGRADAARAHAAPTRLRRLRPRRACSYIIVGGGPVTPGLADEARRRFGAQLATRYSCTEAGIGLGTAFDDPDEDAVVSVGRPHASVELAVLDDDDASGRRPARSARCACAPPPSCRATGATPSRPRAAFTADGFVRTGDLGWIDDRGRLRLVGRSKEMYVRGGYNVYPVEVESVLSTHPDVAAVAVVPRPDDVMGEIGVAVVVPRDPARPPTLDELRAFARAAHRGLQAARGDAGRRRVAVDRRRS